MNILLKSAKIIDPNSSFHSKTLDILIHNGIIHNIGKNISAPKQQLFHIKTSVFRLDGLTAVYPLVNLVMRNEKPYPMGLGSLLHLALRILATIPIPTPYPSPRLDISFLLRSAADTPQAYIPKHISQSKTTAQQLAELHDLSAAGAVSFSNHKKSIDNPHLLLLALQYARGFTALIESFPLDSSTGSKWSDARR